MRVRTGSPRLRSRPRGGEQGVVLIMTLLVLFITIAMVSQLSIGASVAWNSTRYRVDKVRMELAARSVAADLTQMLIDDAAGADGMSGMGEALGANGFGAPPSSDPEAAPGDEGAPAEEEAPHDSYQDAWAKEMRVSIGDIEVRTMVQCENGKFDLHRILDGDDEQREMQRERVVRILDAMRDGFDDDLSEPDARRIVDELQTLMDRRRRDRDVPLPARHSLSDDDQEILLDSLEELILLESVDESLFYDQVRSDERIAPGIETVFTIYLNPAFEQAGSGELDSGNGLDGSGLDGSAPEEAAPAPTGQDPLDSESTSIGEGGMQGVLEADPPIALLINLNTSPRAVLEGMFPSWELESAKVEALIRWRNDPDEEAIEEQRNEQVDPAARELRDALYGIDEEEPKQVFRSLEDISQVEGFEEENATPEVLAALQAEFGVQSDVFTLYMWARVRRDDSWEQERHYQEPPGQALRLRAVVWRAMTPEGPKLVFLRPWHEVPYTRFPIPDYQRELPAFREKRFR